MARKIRFALKMANDEMVRTIEELRAHFDMGKALEYFMKGNLLQWAEDHCAEEITKGLRGLSAEDEALAENLCHVLGVEYKEKYGEIGKEKDEAAKREELIREAMPDESLSVASEHVALTPREILTLWKQGVKTAYYLENKTVHECVLREKKELLRKRLA